MKKLLSLAVFVVAGIGSAQEAVGTNSYDHLATGFSFQYPANWKLKKERDYIVFEYPIEGDRKATLQVFASEYTGDIPTWQAVETNAAKQLKREVVRQWQEEILTVPMLMSRTQWTEKDSTPKTADIAMIYSETRRKLLFRLTANSEDIERAYGPFRTLLQSIKTEDGKLPKPFDPSKPHVENVRRRDDPGKRQVWTQPKRGTAAPVKGDQTVETTASNIALLVRFFSPWKGTVAESGMTFELPGGPSGLRVAAYSANESDQPGKALIKASGRSLARLNTGIERSEVGPFASKSGATAAVIWRTGQAESGPMVTMDAVITVGDYYVLVYWESSDVKNAKLREQVNEFVQTLSVELKPGT